MKKITSFVFALASVLSVTSQAHAQGACLIPEGEQMALCATAIHTLGNQAVINHPSYRAGDTNYRFSVDRNRSHILNHICKKFGYTKAIDFLSTRVMPTQPAGTRHTILIAIDDQGRPSLTTAVDFYQLEKILCQK